MIINEKTALLIRNIIKEKHPIYFQLLEYNFLENYIKTFKNEKIQIEYEENVKNKFDLTYNFLLFIFDYFKLIFLQKYIKAESRLNKYLLITKFFPHSLKDEYEKLTDINKYNDILLKFPFNRIRNISDELLSIDKILEIYLNTYFSFLLFFIVKHGGKRVFPEILPNFTSILLKNSIENDVSILSDIQISLLLNKYFCLINKIKKKKKLVFYKCLNSRNIMEIYLNFIDIYQSIKLNEEFIYSLFKKNFKKLNGEVFFKTLIMLINLSKSKKREIFSYILSREVSLSTKNIITIINIFDLSNIGEEKCHDLIKYLFSKPFKDINTYIFFENLFKKLISLHSYLSNLINRESDVNNRNRMNGLINIIFLIVRENVTNYFNDHFLIYILFSCLNKDFFYSINCELNFNIEEKKIEIHRLLNKNRKSNLNNKIDKFLKFYFKLEDIFKFNFNTFLIEKNVFNSIFKLNFEIDLSMKITEINKNESSIRLIKDFKIFLHNLIFSLDFETVGHKIVKFYLNFSNQYRKLFLDYCHSLPNVTKSYIFDYEIQIENDKIKLLPIRIDLIDSLDIMTLKIDQLLISIEMLVNFLGKNNEIIYSLFKQSFEKLLSFNSESNHQDYDYNDELSLLKEHTLIDDETISKLGISIEKNHNITKCILLKIIDCCSKKIDINIFKTPDIFNIIYLILEQHSSDEELVELSINCLGFSIINYEQLCKLIIENKDIILKLYSLIKILDNYQNLEVAKEIKVKLLHILSLKEINEMSPSDSALISFEEEEILKIIDNYIKNVNSKKYNDNFEKSYSLYLILDKLKIYKRKSLSLKTTKLIYDLLLENVKNIDSYLSNVAIKALSLLGDHNIVFFLNLLLESIKSIQIKQEGDAENISFESQFLSKIIEIIHKIVRRYRDASSSFLDKLFGIIIYFFENSLYKLDKANLTGLLMLLSTIVKYCGISLQIYLDMIIRTALNFLNNHYNCDIDIRISSSILLFKIIQNCNIDHFSIHAKSIYNSIKLNLESSIYNKGNKKFKFHLNKSILLIQEYVKEFYLPTSQIMEDINITNRYKI